MSTQAGYNIFNCMLFSVVGIYSEISVTKFYTLTYSVYAHRTLTNLIVVEVELVRRGQVDDPLKLIVDLNRWQPSYDLTFVTEQSGRDELRLLLN